MADGSSTRDDVVKRLKALREWAGYDSQTAFAEWMGIGGPEWNHYETGRRPLTLKAANILRARLRVTLDWIYHGDRSGLSIEVDRSLPRIDDMHRRRAS